MPVLGHFPNALGPEGTSSMPLKGAFMPALDARKFAAASFALPLAALSLLAPLSGCGGGGTSGPEGPDPQQNVKVIDDRPGSASCVNPQQLPQPSGDVNNQPQAEVTIDVSPDGRIAAAAKDLRYSPTDDAEYNLHVWDGLYLSDVGLNWSNRLFEDSGPNTGFDAVTDGT